MTKTMSAATRPDAAHDTSGQLREPRPPRHGASVALWSACALLLMSAGSLGFAVVSTRNGISQADQLARLRLDSELLLTELKDVETGQRGFLVTGNRVFLDPYNDARPRIAAMLTQVIAELDRIASGRQADALAGLVQQKLQLTDQAIEMAKAGHLDQARDEVGEGDGKRVMDAIRVAISGVSAFVDDHRDQTARQTDRRSTWASVVALASAVLASLMVGATALLLNRQSAARLRLAEESRALALNAAALGTWEWDCRSDGVNASATTRRLFGLSMTNALSLADLLSVIVADDRALAEAAVRGSSATDQCDWEGRVAMPDGKIRRFHVFAGLYRDDAGRPTVLRGVAQDVTARRQAEQHTQELELELWHAARVATVGEVASTTAHELAQPISAARTFFQGCDTMLRSDRPYDQEKLLSGMTRGLDGLGRASSIVQNLHRFLRKEAVQREPMALNAAVRDAVGLGAVGFERDQKGQIVYTLAPDLPDIVANRTHIQQVVVNLVRNGVEAMEPFERRELRIGTVRHGHDVRLTVGDTGPGLPPAFLETPFQAFATTKPDGLGLGLSICRSIVQANGGRIDFETGPAGTTFLVDLPAATG